MFTYNNMSTPASLGLTKEGNEYRILGKKGGLIKINKLTVPQLKAYGAKYTTFNNKNRTKKQIMNKIYAAKTKLRQEANAGNSVAASLLASQHSASPSYNANAAAAQALAAVAAHKPAAGGHRISALLNVAAQKPSATTASAAASLGLLQQFGASGGHRFKGKKGPKKANKTMTVPVLKAYAAKHGVNASKLRTKKEILNAIYRKKYPKSNSAGSVNAVLNNVLVNVGKSSAPSSFGITAMFKTPKARPRPRPRPRPSPSGSPGSFGLLQQFGASGGHRFKGKKGPKKANKTMTIAALKAYAARHGVNTNTLRTKKEILNAIYRKKYPKSNSSGSVNAVLNNILANVGKSSGPVLITHSQAAAMLAGRKKSSNKPHVRPKVRPPRPAAGPVKPVKLTAAQLNKLLGGSAN
jgi:heterodisulfide reductase subunit C